MQDTARSPDRKWILQTAKELLEDAKGKTEIDHQACARYLQILAGAVIGKGVASKDDDEMREARDAVMRRAERDGLTAAG
jgi:hypothetical protein